MIIKQLLRYPVTNYVYNIIIGDVAMSNLLEMFYCIVSVLEFKPCCLFYIHVYIFSIEGLVRIYWINDTLSVKFKICRNWKLSSNGLHVLC